MNTGACSTLRLNTISEECCLIESCRNPGGQNHLAVGASCRFNAMILQGLEQDQIELFVVVHRYGYGAYAVGTID